MAPPSLSSSSEPMDDRDVQQLHSYDTESTFQPSPDDYVTHEEDKTLADILSINPSNESSSRKPLQSVSVGTRFLVELNPCQPWFHVCDPATSRKIDIPDSFAPPTCTAFLYKLVAGCLTIGTLGYGWVVANAPAFYLGSLTTWAMVLSSLYFVASITNTVMAAYTPQPPDAVYLRIRLTWILYELALHTQLLSVIAFWVLVYDNQPVTYLLIVPHSIIPVVVWIDGLWVNNIPVRWMHWYGFALPLDAAYIGWTVAYSLLLEPNGAVYPTFPWATDWRLALSTVLIGVLAIGPGLYLVMWLVSIYKIPCLCLHDRRYYVDRYKDEGESRPTVDDVEEGSIFAKWNR